MMRNITPLNDNFQPPEMIKDRSKEVPKVYHADYGQKRYGDRAAKKPSPIPYITQMQYKDALILQLLLAVPYVISFLSIAAIFTLGGSGDVTEAATNRLLTIALTVPALGVWVFALPRLKSYLFNRRLNFLAALVAFGFLILPVLDVSIALRSSGVADAAILAATFMLAQCYFFAVVYAAKASAAASVRIFVPAFIVLLAIVAAAIV